MVEGVERPSGTVTFLFTDIVGSTSQWELDGESMNAALAAHDEILRSCVDAGGGVVFSTAGDAFAAAFDAVGSACRSALEIQDRLSAHPWSTPERIRVRMGLHVGEAHERDGDYFGPVVNRAARIMSAAHGGQVVLSSACASIIGTDGLIDLGEHRLKDLGTPEHLWQLNPGAFPPLRTLDVRRHNLPVERGPLFGRASDVDHVAGLLADNRLVTLLGIGGTGKTRLAVATAAQLVDAAAEGVWFVDLVPAASLADVVTAIATATGLHVSGSDLVGAMAHALHDRETLIVLDNCEHLTEPVAEVVDALLAGTVAPRFLATSREPLDLPDERHVRVRPLEVSGEGASPAVALFVSAADRVGASITPDEIARVGRICEVLDGLPLSIELAAAQLRQLTLEELADRLDERFELLSRRTRGSSSRQASLAAVVEDSWKMLDPSEQDMLLRLAAFPAEFALDDVEALSSGSFTSPASVLGGLVDRGLVSDAGRGRHRLLETIKLFTRKKWEERATTAFRDRHHGWVFDTVTGRTPEEWYTSADAARWAARHYADHRAVEDRLAAEGSVDELSQLLAGLTFAYNVEHGAQASAVVERIAGYLESFDLTEAQRAMLLLTSGAACLPARQPQLMEQQFSAALPYLREQDRLEALTVALSYLATIRGIRETDAALEMLDEAVAETAAAGSDVMCEYAQAFRCGILAGGGRIDDSADQLTELRLRLRARSANDYASWICDLVDVGVHVLHEPSRSQRAAERATRFLEYVEGTPMISWPYLVVSSCPYAAAGDVDAASAAVERTIQSATVAGEEPLPDILVPLALLAWRLGDESRARRWLSAVRHASTPTHGFYVTIIYRQLRARIGLSAGDRLEAVALRGLLDEAVEWLRDLSSVPTVVKRDDSATPDDEL